jgi:hypothetical protein
LKEISMTEVTGEPIGESVRGEPAVRIDWRAGQPMVQHDDAFWRAHERRRIEQDLSVQSAAADTSLTLVNALTNTGSIAAATDLSVQAGSLTNGSGGALRAGNDTNVAVVGAAIDSDTSRVRHDDFGLRAGHFNVAADLGRVAADHLVDDHPSGACREPRVALHPSTLHEGRASLPRSQPHATLALRSRSACT